MLTRKKCISAHQIYRTMSILKRGVVGTYHKVSTKYLPLYVAEFQFRYNNRLNDDIFGEAIRGRRFESSLSDHSLCPPKCGGSTKARRAFGQAR
jgi:hypothetical protein